jgi:hypothetical protein
VHGGVLVGLVDGASLGHAGVNVPRVQGAYAPGQMLLAASGVSNHTPPHTHRVALSVMCWVSCMLLPAREQACVSHTPVPNSRPRVAILHCAAVSYSAALWQHMKQLTAKQLACCWTMPSIARHWPSRAWRMEQPAATCLNCAQCCSSP